LIAWILMKGAEGVQSTKEVVPRRPRPRRGKSHA
jgi:hypothetical protein